jgi:hypothetical protein
MSHCHVVAKEQATKGTDIPAYRIHRMQSETEAYIQNYRIHRIEREIEACIE